jgi:hypothetical protein
MAKKHSRKVSNASAQVSAVVEASPTARRRLTSTEFNPDYSDIVHDLKRIGVLAASFFVVLIALSFILR